MQKPPTVKSTEELSSVLKVYSEATDRLEKSHSRLVGKVSHLSAELEQKNKLLERKTRLEVLGEMAAGVAHEIRNPLGGILLYAGLLERDLADSPAHLRLVRSILTGVRALESGISDLLSFTRGFEPSPFRCGLKAVAEGALRDAVGELARTDIKVHREYREPDVELVADPHLLRRALLNLILNAIQSTGHEGDLTVRTGVSEAGGGSSCWIEIRDTGEGIAQEVHGRLFEPYVTNRQGGTGLGLAIVQKIVESHGATVAARNLEEGGACFTVTLPLELHRHAARAEKAHEDGSRE